jgi:flagellar protein FliS
VNQDYSQYMARAVQTASPGQLVVMLYDGFLRFCAQAEEALAQGDVNTAGNRLTRAADIVNELRISLDVERGGEIAVNLSSIYVYVAECLMHARVRRDPERIREARRHMAELRAAWAQIAQQRKPEVARTAPAMGLNLVG